MTLPNLIVIGAMKSGTSSLHAYLDLHPDVAMSKPKELHFFADNATGNWRRGVEWYAAHWPTSAAVRGESSPSYTQAHQIPGVPERMHRLIPDARLIYVVRDPIDRIGSHWLHNVRNGRERRPLETALQRVDRNIYVDTSRYHHQLSQYLRWYPMDRILVLDLNDLQRQPEETMRGVFRFVGVDASFSSPGFRRRHHRSDLKAPPTRVGRVVRAAVPGRVWRLGQRMPVFRIALLQRIPPTHIRGAVRERLVEELAQDVAALRRTTGQRFAGWSL